MRARPCRGTIGGLPTSARSLCLFLSRGRRTDSSIAEGTPGSFFSGMSSTLRPFPPNFGSSLIKEDPRARPPLVCFFILFLERPYFFFLSLPPLFAFFFFFHHPPLTCTKHVLSSYFSPSLPFLVPASSPSSFFFFSITFHFYLACVSMYTFV